MTTPEAFQEVQSHLESLVDAVQLLRPKAAPQSQLPLSIVVDYLAQAARVLRHIQPVPSPDA